MVVQTLIERTKSFSGLKDGELELLLDFSNAVCNLVEAMRLMSCDGHQNNPQLRQELVGKLRTTLRLQWGEFAAKQESPLTLTKFSTWLSERANAVCEILPPTQKQPQAHHRRHGNDRQRPETTLTASESKHPVQCFLCSVEHPILTCPKFKELSCEARQEWIELGRRCSQCFCKGHTTQQCRRQGKCGVGGCRGKHHALHAHLA